MHAEERYQELCSRLPDCWSRKGGSFTYPPATEEQLVATEAQLGFPLPPLLRLLYREVANGGNGLVWYDDQFPFFGAYGGCPCPKFTNWPGISPWGAGSTIAELVRSSGWQLHPCIAEALCRHPRCYILCDQPPTRCIPINFLGGTDVVILDPTLGRLYELSDEGTLSLEENEIVPLCSLRFYKRSLEDLLEEFLTFLGCGAPAAASARARTVPDTSPDLAGATRRELTPDDLDPGGATDSGIWHGLYRGLSDYLPDAQGRWEADDLSTSGQGEDEPRGGDS
jgi:hypothetical protein